MNTQVAIVGGGVAGLLLSHLLHVEGVECVILERQTRAYSEARIRAGVLESGTVNLLRRIGVNARMDKVGLRHEGFALMDDGEVTRIPLRDLTGSGVMVYGQIEITIDLMDACAERGTPLIFEADQVALHDFDGAAPCVTYVKAGQQHRLECDYIAGCDGFHGICRKTLPHAVEHAIEKVYPFGWLGILSDVPPMDHELIYSNHERGFALASQRSQTRSR